MFNLCQAVLHYNNKIDSLLRYFTVWGWGGHIAEAYQGKEDGRDSPRGLPGEQDIGVEFGKMNESLTGRWTVRIGVDTGSRVHSKQNQDACLFFCTSPPSRYLHHFKEDCHCYL